MSEGREPMTDQEILDVASWTRDVPSQQCSSLIIGTDSSGTRDVHQCNIRVDLRMHGHKTHHCDCGESWRYLKGDERWSAVGPLTEVVMP